MAVIQQVYEQAMTRVGKGEEHEADSNRVGGCAGGLWSIMSVVEKNLFYTGTFMPLCALCH